MPVEFKGPLEVFGVADDVTPSASQAGTTQDVNGGVSGGNQNPSNEQSIPYARFHEVNERARQAEQQRDQLLERVLTLQGTQQGQTPERAAAEAQAQVQSLNFAMSDADKERLATELAIDPGAAVEGLLKDFSGTINGYLEQREKQLAERIEKQYAPVVQQFQGFVGSQATDQFAQRAFSNPQLQPVKPQFDALVNQARQSNPQLLQSEQGLQSLLQLAVGQAALAGTFNSAGLQGQNAPFSEQPGFGGQPQFAFNPGANQRPNVPAQVLEKGRAMGLSDDRITAMYLDMAKRGSFGD